jgi:SNF2 family DNA or RNA helicase
MNKRRRTSSLGERDEAGKRGKGLELDTDVPKARGAATPILRSPNAQQTEMVRFGQESLRKYGGVVLAGQMGSGKTGAGLMLGALMDAPGPTLFICTVSIIGGVEGEVRKFFGDGVSVVVLRPGSSDVSFPADTDIVITNRETLTKLEGYQWGTVIIDEAHDLRNPHTDRYATMLGLQATYRVLLTGTPVNNTADEIVSLLEQAGLLTVTEGMSHRQYMQKEWSRVLLCIQRSCLRINFDPGKKLDRMVIPVCFTDMEAEEHRAAIEQAMSEIDSRSAFHVFGRALNMCGTTEAKLRAVDELLDNFDPERGMIFFATMRVMQEMILQRCVERELPVGFINGLMNMDERQEQVDRLNNGDIRILVCSRKACQTGLNLQGAADIVIVDLQSCNPFDYLQLECRAYRAGQSLDVRVYMLVIAETVESYIPRIHARKIERARGILKVIPTPKAFANGRLRESFVRESRACFLGIVDEEKKARRTGVVMAGEEEVVNLIMRTYRRDGTFITDEGEEEEAEDEGSSSSTAVTPRQLGKSLWG